MHKKLLTLLTLSIFIINPLYAGKSDEEKNRKRQHEENDQNIVPKKKKKLTKLETEQQQNYPETLTWDTLIKAFPDRNSKHLDFIKNNIKNENEKNDFLNAFKKLYCKNTPLSQNCNILVSLSQYFQNLYYTNIDRDMNLINIIVKSFAPTETGNKQTITSMAETLRTKNLQKKTITLIQKIVDELTQKEKNTNFISTIVSYTLKLKEKNRTEEKIYDYIKKYNETYLNQENTFIINNASIQSEINFTHLYDNLNETNKTFFQNLSPDLKNSLKKALHIKKDKDENIFLKEFKDFYTKFPYLFELKDEYVIAYFKNSSFYTMSDDELNYIATHCIPLFKTTLGNSWQTALTLCRQLSFIKIKFLCKILSLIENPNKRIQEKFITFMSHCIDIDTLENQLNFYKNSLEEDSNIIDIDQMKPFSLIKNLKNKFLELTDENICIFPLTILYNLNPITLNPSPVTYRDFLKKESALLNNLFHLFDKPANLECVNKALENISSFLFTLITHTKNKNDSNNAIETLEKLRHLHRKIQAINSINALQDNHLKNLLGNYFQNHSDTFIENIPKLIFYHITNAHIDIKDILSNIFHKQLTYIAHPDRYQNLTATERNTINDILHYFLPCLEAEPNLLAPSQRVKMGNNDIYYELIDMRRHLNQIIARLNGAEANYNDRQSLHNKETHKAIDDMIQELWTKFPLNKYNLKRQNFIKFYDSIGNINDHKTNDITNLRIDLLINLFCTEEDFKKYNYFLFDTLRIPTLTHEELSNIFDQFSNNRLTLSNRLNSYSKEIELCNEFSIFLKHYFYEFKNNPTLTEVQKDISFREIFNKACIHLEEIKRISENGPILSKEEIHTYVNSFLSIHAKNLILKIVGSMNAERTEKQFYQPNRGSYADGLFALLFRTILTIIESTPNENDLNDKFLTLRNNLAHAHFEYVDLLADKEDDYGNIITFEHALLIGTACDYGKSYAMLEPFLNVLNADNTITIDSSNFTPIIMNFIQEEVERIQTLNLTIDEKLTELKKSIIDKLKNSKTYTQDFWEDQTLNPLKQINEIVEGLRSCFEDDDEIMIEEKK